MPFMPWSDAYSVDIASIDNQHKHLVSMINGMHEVLKAGAKQDHLEAVLQDLLTYTQGHFAHEEEAMARARYAGLAGHQRKHKAMRAEVERLLELSSTNRATVSIKLMDFLKDWLTKHICQTDREYAPSLKAAKIG
jgi:hemerythrin